MQHLHPVKRISFVTPDPDDQKVFGIVCSQPDCSTGYKFYALESENVRGTKETICFVNWITEHAWANCRRSDAWLLFETCLVHCVVLLMGSDVSLSQCVSLLRNMWRYWKTAKELAQLSNCCTETTSMAQHSTRVRMHAVPLVMSYAHESGMIELQQWVSWAWQ